MNCCGHGMTPFLRALYLEFFPPCLDALESYLILCTLNIFVNLTLFVVQIDKKKERKQKNRTPDLQLKATTHFGITCVLNRCAVHFSWLKYMPCTCLVQCSV